PFVGREEELRLLLSCWERAREGEGQLVVVIGGGNRQIAPRHGISRAHSRCPTYMDGECRRAIVREHAVSRDHRNALAMARIARPSEYRRAVSTSRAGACFGGP